MEGEERVREVWETATEESGECLHLWFMPNLTRAKDKNRKLYNDQIIFDS